MITEYKGINRNELHNALKNAALFASKDKALPILNAVKFEAVDGGIRLTATDRFVLGAAFVADQDDAVPAPLSFLLSTDNVKRVLDLVKLGRTSPKSATVDITVDDYEERVTFDTLWDGSATVDTLEGDYPRIKALFPDVTPDQISYAPSFGLDPKYAALLGKIKDHRGGQAPAKYLALSLGELSGKPIPFTFGDFLSGMVMPVRLWDQTAAPHSWAKAPELPAAAEVAA